MIYGRHWINLDKKNSLQSKNNEHTNEVGKRSDKQRVNSLLKQLQSAETDTEKAQIIDKLPKHIKTQLVIRNSQFAGPLPPPEQLKGYEEVLSGAADRIIKMAEDQAHHRQQIETIVVKSNSRDSIFGIICAFVLGIILIGGGICLALKGHSYGPWLSIGGFATLAGVFVYGTGSNRKERAQKGENRKK